MSSHIYPSAWILAALFGLSSCSEEAKPDPTELPSIQEQYAAQRDPVHAPYLALLYAADNFASCEDKDGSAQAVLAERDAAVALAEKKGLKPSMELTRRVYAMKGMAELRMKCVPNLSIALGSLRQATAKFTDVVQRVPSRAAD